MDQTRSKVPQRGLEAGATYIPSKDTKTINKNKGVGCAEPQPKAMGKYSLPRYHIAKTVGTALQDAQIMHPEATRFFYDARMQDKEKWPMIFREYYLLIPYNELNRAFNPYDLFNKRYGDDTDHDA